MPENNPREALKALDKDIDELEKITLETLIQSERLGQTFDFKEGESGFRSLITFFKNLKHYKLEDLPKKSRDLIHNRLGDTMQFFKRVKAFNPTVDNAEHQQKQLIAEGDSLYDSIVKQLSPYLSIVDKTDTYYKDKENEASSYVSSIKNTAEEAEKLLKEKVAASEKMLKTQRDAMKFSATEEHIDYFDKEAQAHKKRSKFWAGVSLGLGIVTVLTGIYFLNQALTRVVYYDMARAIQIGAAKFLIFAVLYFGLVWASKNYRAQVHNYIINRHRYNALKTFERFVASTKEPKIQDAILYLATQSVFTPQFTGFIGKDESHVSLKLSDMAKHIFDSSSSQT